jgi:hypothetical protein
MPHGKRGLFASAVLVVLFWVGSRTAEICGP